MWRLKTHWNLNTFNQIKSPSSISIIEQTNSKCLSQKQPNAVTYVYMFFQVLSTILNLEPISNFNSQACSQSLTWSSFDRFK